MCLRSWNPWDASSPRCRDKPGQATALGFVNTKPIVCMPGYPVAGMVALYFFARQALHKLAHIPDEPERVVRAVLSEKIPGRTGFKTFARVKLEPLTTYFQTPYFETRIIRDYCRGRSSPKSSPSCHLRRWYPEFGLKGRWICDNT